MSRPTDTGAEADFLSWGHQGLSFLAPRGFCESGVFCPDDEVDPRGFLVHGLEYDEQTVPVFDLHGGLEAWFGHSLADSFPQALVVSTARVTPRTRDLLEATLGHTPPLLGFRIRSETRMVRLRADQVSWFGRGATRALAARGLLGCRFPSPDQITYLIDPEALLCGALEGLQEGPRARTPR